MLNLVLTYQYFGYDKHSGIVKDLNIRLYINKQNSRSRRF